MLPLIAGATLYLRQRDTDRRVGPIFLTDILTWLAFFAITAVAAVQHLRPRGRRPCCPRGQPKLCAGDRFVTMSWQARRSVRSGTARSLPAEHERHRDPATLAQGPPRLVRRHRRGARAPGHLRQAGQLRAVDQVVLRRRRPGRWPLPGGREGRSATTTSSSSPTTTPTCSPPPGWTASPSWPRRSGRRRSTGVSRVESLDAMPLLWRIDDALLALDRLPAFAPQPGPGGGRGRA